MHKYIEELSLNHWPALSTLVYDGWLLRFANGYTKRANSVSALYAGSFNVEDKIVACERLYSEQQLPATFKITPYIQPNELDELLAAKGYAKIDPTSVRTVSLERIASPRGANATIVETVQPEWVERFCRLNRIAPQYRQTMTQMLSNYRTKTGFITLFDQERLIAVGLGVIERGYIGIYDIVTDEAMRNRGFGEQLLLHLLHWGKENGASYSYLAVLQNNPAAQRLYDKLGFKECYTYWYRTQLSKHF
ncbi:GNAT family N-acetyltransferase [Paenibacillus sp. GCM10027626]|uniref:GNAT family N-acetyltransferase n=1 Tax=Paenibacillus sp. GCM10027626 TaxID=3273411 RepID=UPI003641C4B3